MIRKLFGAMLVLSIAGFAAADEIDAILKKVENGGKTVRLTPVKLNAKGEIEARYKLNLGATTADSVTVVMGKYNVTDKKWEVGEAIKNGLNAEMFKDPIAKDIQVHITRQPFGKNLRITQIIVLSDK